MLYEQDGLTQAELCKRINVEQPTMANTLNRMERDGLIKRVADPADKRRARIHLTDRAKEMQSGLMEKARAVPARALAGLPSADQDKVFGLIAQMIDRLKADST